METSTGIHRADRRCGHLCVACGLKAALAWARGNTREQRGAWQDLVTAWSVG